MRSFRILLASALVAVLAVACAYPVEDSLEPVADAPSASPEVDSGSVLSFLNGAEVDGLIGDGELSLEEAEVLIQWRKANGAFKSLDQLTSALDTTPRSVMSAGMCTYYQNQASYYQIRALQCAYSYCYAMSPWYGYLANYYSKLAQSVCPTTEPG